MIAIVGILIVFASLALISFIIRLLKHAASPVKKKQAEAVVPTHNGVSGEVVAAIAAALQHHLFELHDEERTIITIKKVSKPYSPWSSKLYGMTPSPLKHISNR
ncbi:MAG: OadG family protein [Bacteroidetes bacterium]|nr:OadG family protein [Bacteroidota bacterium]